MKRQKWTVYDSFYVRTRRNKLSERLILTNDVRRFKNVVEGDGDFMELLPEFCSKNKDKDKCFRKIRANKTRKNNPYFGFNIDLSLKDLEFSKFMENGLDSVQNDLGKNDEFIRILKRLKMNLNIIEGENIALDIDEKYFCAIARKSEEMMEFMSYEIVPMTWFNNVPTDDILLDIIQEIIEFTDIIKKSSDVEDDWGIHRVSGESRTCLETFGKLLNDSKEINILKHDVGNWEEFRDYFDYLHKYYSIIRDYLKLKLHGVSLETYVKDHQSLCYHKVSFMIIWHLFVMLGIPRIIFKSVDTNQFPIRQNILKNGNFPVRSSMVMNNIHLLANDSRNQVLCNERVNLVVAKFCPKQGFQRYISEKKKVTRIISDKKTSKKSNFKDNFPSKKDKKYALVAKLRVPAPLNDLLDNKKDNLMGEEGVLEVQMDKKIYQNNFTLSSSRNVQRPERSTFAREHMAYDYYASEVNTSSTLNNHILDYFKANLEANQGSCHGRIHVRTPEHISKKRKSTCKVQYQKRSKKVQNVFGSRNHDVDLLLSKETKCVSHDNCLYEMQICSDLNGYSNNNMCCKRDNDHHDKNHLRDQMWSGDCRISSGSQDSFLENFEDIMDSTTLTDVEDISSKDHFMDASLELRNLNRSFLKNDVDFDEGFSENDSLDEVGPVFMFKKAFEMDVTKECLRYCGDCDYNSSNSKVHDTFDKGLKKEEVHKEVCSCDDDGSRSVSDEDDEDEEDDGEEGKPGSDSDGGTEILNSVNDSVNQFNHIMEHCATEPTMYLDSTKSWIPSLPESKTTFDSGLTVLTPLVNETTESIVTQTLIPSSTTIERVSPMSSVVPYQHHHHQQISIVNLSNYNNQEPISKMVPSSINLQNWCSYNYPPSQSYNLSMKPSKSYEMPMSSFENYDIPKVSPWLPYVSQNMPGNSPYNMGPGAHHPQLQRILFPPHLTLPTMNLNTVQHNIIHLPQLFQQSQHSIHDTEYMDHRFATINPKLFSSGNHSCDFYVPSLALTDLSNSNNHCTSSLSKGHPCQSPFKGSLDKSQRACCFYMRGGCKKEDCEYAHDLSKVTCKFWEKGDCFKADTCPFKHGYQKE